MPTTSSGLYNTGLPTWEDIEAQKRGTAVESLPPVDSADVAFFKAKIAELEREVAKNKPQKALETVSLAAISTPRVEGVNTAQEFVSYVARVSNPSNQLNMETAPKLISYLLRNSHWSPLEMVSLTVEVNTTRDIARQILRHRSFSFQEFSQRYADPTTSLGFSTREARLQDKKNRQNSIEVTSDDELIDHWQQLQKDVIMSSKQAYEWAIDHGIAKEQARAVLPEGLTNSRLYMAGTLRSWIHYLTLRTAHGTQKEHMAIAQEIWDKIISVEFPDVVEAVRLMSLDEK